VWVGKTFATLVEAFINNPYQRLESQDPRVVAY